MKNNTRARKFFGLGIKAYVVFSLIILQMAVLLAQAEQIPDIETIIDRLEYNQVFESSKSSATLTVTNNLGIVESSFESYALKNNDTLVVINTGPDRGQKVLRQGESIFLYYPDAEEIIRLQGSALRNSMMGSDFSYEDLTGDNSIRAKFTYEFLGTEIIDGKPCYHVVFTAKSRREIYQKEELFIDAELFAPRKTILYSASGKALREMYSTDFRTVAGRNIAYSTLMTDLLKKNSTTLMELIDVEIDIPLDADLFSRENLLW